MRYPKDNMKRHPEYKGYLICDTGHVFSITRKVFLKTRVCEDGYLTVNITVQKKRKCRSVHRLVAETFLPNPNNYPMVLHKDGDKKNNCAINLRWGTAKMNSVDYMTHRLTTLQKQAIPFLLNFYSIEEVSELLSLQIPVLTQHMNDISELEKIIGKK